MQNICRSNKDCSSGYQCRLPNPTDIRYNVHDNSEEHRLKTGNCGKVIIFGGIKLIENIKDNFRLLNFEW